MKNLSFKSILAILSAAAVIATVIVFMVNTACGVICAVLSAVLISAFSLFELNRARSIENINDYLSRVCTGNYSLDIQDNFEGEISILKNNIYKVVVMLKTTNEALSKEKLSLAASLADITHQLKTPLTSITVMADLIENEKDYGKRQEFFGIIKTQIEKMNWLTATLLKLSQLDADAVSFEKSAVKISDVIHASVNPFLLQLDLKNIAIIYDYKDFEFIGDSAWTSEAIKNIIKNCIEHTENGKIKITTNETNVYSELTISDTGTGIDPLDLPHIFKRFYHGKNASANSVGIGLNLAQEILTKENANITALSEPNKGTQFKIKFYKTVI